MPPQDQSGWVQGPPPQQAPQATPQQGDGWVAGPPAPAQPPKAATLSGTTPPRLQGPLDTVGKTRIDPNVQQVQPWSEPVERGLEFGYKNLVQPFNRMAEYGVEKGRQAAQFGMGLQAATPEAESLGRTGHPDPTMTGVAQGIGGGIGGQATDPRNWPFFAGGIARPLLSKLMAAGFGTQAGAGAVGSLQQLYQNWDVLNPQQRAELGTQAGIDTLFAGMGGKDMLSPHAQAHQTGVVPSPQEAQAPTPNVTTGQTGAAPVTVAPKQPGRAGGYESATPPKGKVGVDTAGQIAPREPGYRTPRAMPSSANLEQTRVGPGLGTKKIEAPTPSPEAEKGWVAGPPQQGEFGGYQEKIQKIGQKAGELRQAGMLPERRQQEGQAPGGQERRYTEKDIPALVEKLKPAGAKESSVYQGVREELEKKRTDVSPKTPPQAAPAPAAEASRKPVGKEPVYRSGEQPKPAEPPAAKTVEEPKPTLEQARRAAWKDAPKVEKGMSEDQKREVAKKRNEFLAQKAKERQQQGIREVTEERHPLHQSLTRYLKAGGQGDLPEQIAAVGEADKPRLQKEFADRSEKAERTIKEVERLQGVKDLDAELKRKLGAGEVRGKEFTGTEGRFGGERKLVNFVRSHPNELTAFWNRIRGNALKSVQGVDPTTRKPLPDFTKEDPEVAKKVAGWEDQLGKVMNDIRRGGGKYTDEQEKEASTLMANIQAATGKYQISTKGPSMATGEKGEPLSTGTKQSQGYLNAVMGRPYTSHFAKPTPEEFQARIKYLRTEAAASKVVSEQLAGKPEEAPKTPDKPPEKAVEPRKEPAKAEVPKAPEEAPETHQKAELREVESRIRALERSGEHTETLERLRKTANKYRQMLGEPVEHEVTAEEILAKAKKGEAPPKEVTVIHPEELGYKSGAPRGESAEDLTEHLQTNDFDSHVEAYEKANPEGRDLIAYPIMHDLKVGNLTGVDADRRFKRALEIYNAGVEKKNPTALAKALEYAKTGKITKPQDPRMSEAGFLGALRLSGVTPSQAMRHFLGKRAGERYANRAARILNERVGDLTSMKRGDIVMAMKKLDSAAAMPVYRKIEHWIEEQNLPAADRTIQLTQAERQRYDREIKPLQLENTRIIKKLAGAGFKPEDIEGLTHRIALKRGQKLEEMMKGNVRMGTGNILTRFASARQHAHYTSMTTPEGRRVVVHETEMGNVHMWSHGADLGTVGHRSDLENNGFTFGRATGREIEAHTETRYFHHALVNNLLENIQLRAAERTHEFMEVLKQDPAFKKLSTRNLEVATTREKPWRQTEMPTFKGYYLEPHIRETLDRAYRRWRGGDTDAYSRASEYIKNSIFWMNPVLHVPNIAAHWYGEKGMVGFLKGWAGPTRYKTILRAWKAIMDPSSKDAQDAFAAGAPLMRAPDMNDATHLIITKALQQTATGPQGTALAKAFGLDSGLTLAKRLARVSKNITWGAHDFAILQATYERMARKNEDFITSMRNVTRHIPNYRTPARIWNSRTLGKLFDTPGLSIFSAYHYGAFRSYGEIVREFVKPMKESDRVDALDRALALGALTFLIYPMMDKFAKMISSDQRAMWRRAGGSTFIYNMAAYAKGSMKSPPAWMKESVPSEIGLIPMVQGIVTPAPLVQLGERAIGSRELMQKHQTFGAQAKKAGELITEVGAGGSIASAREPYGTGKFNWKRFLFQMIGGRYVSPSTGGQRGKRFGGIRRPRP